ncbi:MAG: hypothetical protein A2X49_11335 [Lentisphaerae bacterium GWF2_52_8]|nr:MAG: hypothetical protein A2X49_11335 [Lentisphaerae bacterium GWF2_52_8]
MSEKTFSLPPCGLYIGSAIYVSFADYTVGLGRLFTCWNPEDHEPEWYLEKTLEENQGNIVQLWPNSTKGQLKSAAWWRGMFKDGLEIPQPDWKNKKMLSPEEWPEIAKNDARYGEGMIDFIRKATEKGIYSMVIYGKANSQYSQMLSSFGKMYLGYDFGEIFGFRFDESLTGISAEDDVKLSQLADGFRKNVKKHCDEYRAAGWGTLMSTCGSFAIDYEIQAGIDLPLFEDYASNVASALCRGLTKQYDLPAWGTHMNHEWYSWLPYSCKYKFESFRNGMYIKYMSGSKILINECGNWYLQSNLCQDSPMLTEMPKLDQPGLGNDYKRSADCVDEARKHYHTINYNSPHARRYRKEISDFYDYVKANGTPAGQPETRIALVKGNLDLMTWCDEFNPNRAIASAYNLADKNPAWYEGAPERGWEIAWNVFFPRRNITGDYYNRYISGTPYGPVDIISFSGRLDFNFLLKNYKTLIFSGWNTCSEEQYSLISEYVSKGGRVFISIPHLSKNETRNYGSYSVSELVNGGNFSELCGVKIKGRGKRFHWATSESPKMNAEFEFPYPRRFGIMGTCMGEIELAADAEIMLCDDEDFSPLMFRRKYGKGEVYFLNSWSYPGALYRDEGPSAELNSPSLIGYIFKHLANRSRGTVYITDDGLVPGHECDHIMFSYFPEDGRVCLMNIDFDRPHSFKLHLPDSVREISLSPSEFRQFKTIQ